ncbi:unnamed protein product [Absidia cylindrospora]
MTEPDTTVLNEVATLAKEKQILELRLQTKNIRETIEALANWKTSRIAQQKKKERRTSILLKAHDSFRLPGLDGTLGPLLLQLFGQDILVKDPKSRYFAWLNKNCIVDLSNFTNGSQMKRKKSKLINNLLYGESESVDLDAIFGISEGLEKRTTDSKAAVFKIDSLTNYKTTDKQAKSIRRVLLYILPSNRLLSNFGDMSLNNFSVRLKGISFNGVIQFQH